MAYKRPYDVTEPSGGDPNKEHDPEFINVHEGDKDTQYYRNEDDEFRNENGIFVPIETLHLNAVADSILLPAITYDRQKARLVERRPRFFIDNYVYRVDIPDFSFKLKAINSDGVAVELDVNIKDLSGYTVYGSSGPQTRTFHLNTNDEKLYLFGKNYNHTVFYDVIGNIKLSDDVKKYRKNPIYSLALQVMNGPHKLPDTIHNFTLVSTLQNMISEEISNNMELYYDPLTDQAVMAKWKLIPFDYTKPESYNLIGPLHIEYNNSFINQTVFALLEQGTVGYMQSIKIVNPEFVLHGDDFNISVVDMQHLASIYPNKLLRDIIAGDNFAAVITDFNLDRVLAYMKKVFPLSKFTPQFPLELPKDYTNQFYPPELAYDADDTSPFIRAFKDGVDITSVEHTDIEVNSHIELDLHIEMDDDIAAFLQTLGAGYDIDHDRFYSYEKRCFDAISLLAQDTSGRYFYTPQVFLVPNVLCCYDHAVKYWYREPEERDVLYRFGGFWPVHKAHYFDANPNDLRDPYMQWVELNQLGKKRLSIPSIRLPDAVDGVLRYQRDCIDPINFVKMANEYQSVGEPHIYDSLFVLPQDTDEYTSIEQANASIFPVLDFVPTETGIELVLWVWTITQNAQQTLDRYKAIDLDTVSTKVRKFVNKRIPQLTKYLSNDFYSVFSRYVLANLPDPGYTYDDKGKVEVDKLENWDLTVCDYPIKLTKSWIKTCGLDESVFKNWRKFL